MSETSTTLAAQQKGKAYGGQPRRAEHNASRVFTGLLFALFVALLLMAILVGTSVYKTLYQEAEAADTQRLSLTLLANDVRENDQVDAVARAWVTAEDVSLEIAQAGAGLAALEDGAQVEGSLLQGPALVLRETLDSGVYETRIYRYNDTIMEEYSLASAPYDPKKATPIVASSVFDFSYENGLLAIATDAGQVTVALRCEGGGR